MVHGDEPYGLMLGSSRPFKKLLGQRRFNRLLGVVGVATTCLTPKRVERRLPDLPKPDNEGTSVPSS